jgi:hypothetical protein
MSAFDGWHYPSPSHSSHQKFLKPAHIVINRLWLVYRKSERNSARVQLWRDILEEKNKCNHYNFQTDANAYNAIISCISPLKFSTSKNKFQKTLVSENIRFGLVAKSLTRLQGSCCDSRVLGYTKDKGRICNLILAIVK